MQAPTRNLSLRGLRSFCVAAEFESFRIAAERLFVTASAISHQIKNLETELGTRLFDRQQRALVLTPVGQKLYDDIKPLIEQLDAVTAGYRQDAARSSLSISVQPFFASELFVPRLPEFRARHPQIDIAVDTSDESAAKHPVRADASIRIFRSPPAALDADRLFALQLVPAAAPAFRDQLVIKEQRIVSDFPLIVHSTRPKAWQQWQATSGIKLPKNAISLRLDSMIAVVRAAEQGLGAALVPKQLSDNWFAAKRLVPLFDTLLQTSDAYYLVSENTATAETNVKRFREWVLQEFAAAA